MYKKFKESDLFLSRVKAHPKVEFFVNSGSSGLFFNRGADERGASGSVFLGNNLSGSYPFLSKEGSLSSFKTVTTTEYASFDYGRVITGSYPLSSKIFSEYYAASSTRARVDALKNTLNHYKSKFSPYYAFSSSYGDKASQALKLISVPSIFYGSSIEKGTVSCKFFLTGSLIAELGDPNKNGELIQIGPSGSSGSGSVAGVVLYREGFMILTGSWDLHDSYTDNFVPLQTGSTAPAWVHFFTTGSNGLDTVHSSSFEIQFNGTQYTPTMTMLCHASKGEFNHSNNPTYIEYGQDNKVPFSSSTVYRERDNVSIKNLVKTPYTEEEPKFEKVTYVSKVGIFDENKNLIGIAKLATPIRKKEVDSYTLKLKLDI